MEKDERGKNIETSNKFPKIILYYGKYFFNYLIKR